MVFWVVFRYGDTAKVVGQAENCRTWVGFLLGIERKALLVGFKGSILKDWAKDDGPMSENEQ